MKNTLIIPYHPLPYTRSLVFLFWMITIPLQQDQWFKSQIISDYNILYILIIEGSLEVKLPTIWRDEKQSREEAERRERLEERRVEEKE